MAVSVFIKFVQNVFGYLTIRRIRTNKFSSAPSKSEVKETEFTHNVKRTDFC